MDDQHIPYLTKVIFELIEEVKEEIKKETEARRNPATATS